MKNSFFRRPCRPETDERESPGREPQLEGNSCGFFCGNAGLPGVVHPPFRRFHPRSLDLGPRRLSYEGTIRGQRQDRLAFGHPSPELGRRPPLPPGPQAQENSGIRPLKAAWRDGSQASGLRELDAAASRPCPPRAFPVEFQLSRHSPPPGKTDFTPRARPAGDTLKRRFVSRPRPGGKTKSDFSMERRVAWRYLSSLSSSLSCFSSSFCSPGFSGACTARVSEPPRRT